MTQTPATPTPQPKETFWRRRIAKPIAHQLTQGITAEKIALTLAIGSACALFPILGTTTLLCLIVGIALRLNQPLIQLVNALCSVPHILSVYGLIRFGDFIFGVPRQQFTISDFITRRPHTRFFPNIWSIALDLWREHKLILHRFGATALHALVAWAIIAPLWILIIYWLTYPPLKKAALRRSLPIPVAAPGATPPTE